MNNNTVTKNDEVEIDLLAILKVLWSNAWIIVVSMIVLGAILFSYAMFFITPTYKASAKMYVNNSDISVGGTSFSISSSELTAAKSLLEVYVIILKTRITLERVIDEAGLEYTYEELNKMVSANSVNSTEVFEISVVSTSPSEAELIVDKIVDILPDRISEVVEGSRVRLVDHAVIPTEKESPSCTKYAVIGILIGALVSCAAIIISHMLDDTVSGEEYLTQKYDIPVLVVVPDAYSHSHGKYGKYAKYGKYSKYGYYKDYNSATAKTEDE